MTENGIPIRSGGVIEDDTNNEVEEQATAIRPHPLGIKPSGNLYTAASNARLASGHFQQLPDEVLMTVFESFESEVLNLVGSTCRFLYAFSRCDDLWRALFIK